jgi:hypothetical protein
MTRFSKALKSCHGGRQISNNAFLTLFFYVALCTRRKEKHLFSSQVVLSFFIWFLMIILESIRMHTIYLEGRSFWTTWSTSFDVVCESIAKEN